MDSGQNSLLESRTASLKLTYLPDKSAVRWDLPGEYGFEGVPEQTTSLARILMRRLRREMQQQKGALTKSAFSMRVKKLAFISV